MNIVIPMAGFGKRFADSGFVLPKPLIPVIDKPMYRQAVDCLPLALATRIIFIIRENAFSEQLATDIKSNYPMSILVVLKDSTRGQAETVLKCADQLDLAQPTLVHNCDTFITPHLAWKTLLTQAIDGALVTFPAQEPRWSYASVNEATQEVIEMREKKVISHHASTGTYFFKNTIDLLANIHKIITVDHRENNEFYLSTVYQHMLVAHKKIMNVPITSDDMLCFGTPQDLVYALNKLYLTPALME